MIASWLEHDILRKRFAEHLHAQVRAGERPSLTNPNGFQQPPSAAGTAVAKTFVLEFPRNRQGQLVWFDNLSAGRAALVLPGGSCSRGSPTCVSIAPLGRTCLRDGCKTCLVKLDRLPNHSQLFSCCTVGRRLSMGCFGRKKQEPLSDTKQV